MYSNEQDIEDIEGQREYEEDNKRDLIKEDFDYALSYFGVNKDITVSEFARALNGLRLHGHDIDANELLNIIMLES